MVELGLVGRCELAALWVVVQLDVSAAGGGGKRRREVHSDEVRLWAAGAGLTDSALIELVLNLTRHRFCSFYSNHTQNATRSGEQSGLSRPTAANDVLRRVSFLLRRRIVSALIEVSARDGTDVLAVFHRLIGQATSSTVRRLEPLLRRRLSGNSARMSAARARLRDKSGGDRDGGGQPTLLQVADTGNRLSRSRSLIRRGSKPKHKRGNDSQTRNDCVIS